MPFTKSEAARYPTLPQQVGRGAHSLYGNRPGNPLWVDHRSGKAALSRGRAAKRNGTRDPAQRLAENRRMIFTCNRFSASQLFALDPGSLSTALRSVPGLRERAAGTLRCPARNWSLAAQDEDVA